MLGMNPLFKPDNPFLRGLERWLPVRTPEGWLPSGWHALKGGAAELQPPGARREGGGVD